MGISFHNQAVNYLGDKPITVCVAIKVNDGIVFAADSAVSLTTTFTDGSSVVANVWNHGLKVFNLHRDLPIVAMFAGMANFGHISISYLAKDLRISLEHKFKEKAYNFNEVVDFTYKYIQDEYLKSYPSPLPSHSFEFWIGGYDYPNKNGEIWKFEIQQGQWLSPTQLVAPEIPDHILWGGQTQAISRLLVGYDPLIPQTFNLDISKLKQFQTPLVHSAMPLQDAIDLAYFLVDMTKKYFAYLPGADIVAGDTDIATVTKHEGFKWINRKHYYQAEFNRRNAGHVTGQ